MILFSLLIFPLIGIFILLCKPLFSPLSVFLKTEDDRTIALFVSTFNFLLSLLLLFFFDFSSNQFQFVIESVSINEYNFYLGIDGISIYFVLLTTAIMPIAILSN
jgi:NADH:ubiquinone oxidoreductase subunit 4 (subunit M)